MEYVQERVRTYHAFDEDVVPPAPLQDCCVVVPMTAADSGRTVTAQTLETLAELDPGQVLVALRAAPNEIEPVRSWITQFDCPVSVCWCNAPAIEEYLRESGLAGQGGKGRDVWLALGIAAEMAEYVVCHDVDAQSYSPTIVPRLCHPLKDDVAFVKGYYARIEEDGLYGRLNRLLYDPLLRALSTQPACFDSLDEADHPPSILTYLQSFRYGLAGEFGIQSSLAHNLQVPRQFGLEVGVLGEAFAHAGMAGSAQVDLGIYRHDHRPVTGEQGLSTMAGQVTDGLCSVLEEHAGPLDYGHLRGTYQSVAETMIDDYRADASFNGVPFDPAHEREQVSQYAQTITPPTTDGWLPSWNDTDLTGSQILEISQQAIDSPTARKASTD